MKIKSSAAASWFYFGTLLSSVGSMALSVALVSFMLVAGFDLLQVSLVIGVSRLVPIVISVFAGHRLDAFAPRTTILITEIAAALASGILFLGWNTLDRNFILILVAMVLRSVFTSAQTGSRGQVTKLLSDSSYQSNSRNAIWLNKVTQGATLFGAVIAWIAVKHLSLEVVILFDALTFVVNGVILFNLPVNPEPMRVDRPVPFTQKFKDLYRINSWAASLDAVLVFSVMGASSFAARLAGSHEEWMPLFVVSYGLAVWTAGYIERIRAIQTQRVLPWLVLGSTLILLGQFREPSAAMWVVCFVKDSAFWILFHRVTSHVQTDTPNELISSVTFARQAQVVSIFSIGEIIVGLWKNSLSLEAECLLRGLVCFAAVTVILSAGRRIQHEKAHL